MEITEHRGLDSLQFSLYVQAGNFSGSMFGLADLKGNTATYRTKDCQLTITFAGNQAVISNADTQCRDYLKPGILLDGTYIRKPMARLAGAEARPTENQKLKADR